MIEASEMKSYVGDVQRGLFCMTGVEVVLEIVREGRENLIPYIGRQIELKGVDCER